MSEEPTQERGKNVEIKLFGRWSLEGIEIENPALRGVISLKPVYLPHSGGRHEHKPFGKLNVMIVERLVNRLMMQAKNAGVKKDHVNSKNPGKKLKALRTVKYAEDWGESCQGSVEGDRECGHS